MYEWTAQFPTISPLWEWVNRMQWHYLVCVESHGWQFTSLCLLLSPWGSVEGRVQDHRLWSQHRGWHPSTSGYRLELWISHFSFLSFIFFIFKIRIVTPTSKCHCENEMKEYKISRFTFMIHKVLRMHLAFKSPHLNLNSAVRLNVQSLFLDISSLCPKHPAFSTSYSVSSLACHYSLGPWAHPVSM